ncbi:MAG: packaged DNA stabilization protein gp10 [Candidatus Berkelbacteria bacterium]|nr:packaged DNA stabilization protein gp10 [Candidatus Berkelbacteria bacterium]
MKKANNAWEKKTIPLFTGQDLTNYNLDTTNGFKISNPSASTATMSRIVNAIPYKHEDKITWRKRPGCKNSTLLSALPGTVGDTFLSSGGYGYVTGVASGGYSAIVATANGTTVTSVSSAEYSSAGGVVYGGASSATGVVPIGAAEITIGSDLWILTTLAPVSSYVPNITITAQYSNGYYSKESDLISGTYGALTGACSVTDGSGVVTGITSTTKCAVNQVISIRANNVMYWTTIVSVDSGTQITVANTNWTAYTGTAYFTKGSLYKITNTNFPGNTPLLGVVGSFVVLNGYSYIQCVNGRIYNSDINDPTTWSATNYITAQMQSDPGRGLALYKNHIVAFGFYSCEFFKDVGNATGSPLQSVPELFLKLGIRQPKHLVQIEDTFGFLANTESGSHAIYILDGFQPKRISTPDIEYILFKIGAANFELKFLRLNGKPCLLINRYLTYALRNNLENILTFVYYIDEGIWGEWKVTEAGTANDHAHPWSYPIGVISGTFYSVSPYTEGLGSGPYITTFLAESDTNYYDNLSASSKPVTFYLQSKVLDGGTLNRKFHSKLKLYHSADTSFNPGTNISVYKSDDFGQTWVTRALTATQAFLAGLGAFRQRIFRVVDATTNFYQMTVAEVEYKEGSK